MTRTVVSFVLLTAWLAPLRGQNPAVESANDVLLRGEIVAGNMQTAITAHLTEDPSFHLSKQLPEDRTPLPRILVKKDGRFAFDWTPGQHARYLMEQIRQGIHSLQASANARGMDAVALAGGRECWPKLRDISCHDAPGTRYYDLDGFEEFCPE